MKARSIKFEEGKFENMNSLFIKLLDQKPVAFNPILGKLSGNANAGLFLSQLLYWHGKGWNKSRMYKTIKEIQNETCLNRSEQDRAIKIWKELGVIEMKLKGIPAKRNFKINLVRLIELISKIKQSEALIRLAIKFAKTSKQYCQFEQTITENTQENTNRDFSYKTEKK